MRWHLMGWCVFGPLSFNFFPFGAMQKKRYLISTVVLPSFHPLYDNLIALQQQEGS
jgi:hypothetical protein